MLIDGTKLAQEKSDQNVEQQIHWASDTWYSIVYCINLYDLQIMSLHYEVWIWIDKEIFEDEEWKWKQNIMEYKKCIFAAFLHFMSIKSWDTVISSQLRVLFNHVEVRSHSGSQLTKKV